MLNNFTSENDKDIWLRLFFFQTIYLTSIFTFSNVTDNELG